MQKKLELTTSIEAILVPQTDEEKNERMANQQQQKYVYLRIMTFFHPL